MKVSLSEFLCSSKFVLLKPFYLSSYYIQMALITIPPISLSGVKRFKITTNEAIIINKLLILQKGDQASEIGPRQFLFCMPTLTTQPLICVISLFERLLITHSTQPEYYSSGEVSTSYLTPCQQQSQSPMLLDSPNQGWHKAQRITGPNMMSTSLMDQQQCAL